MKFMAWYIPQVPGPSYERGPYDNLTIALEVLDAISDFSAFEYDHSIKPDYTEIFGVRVDIEIDGDVETWDVDEWFINEFDALNAEEREKYADVLEYMGIDL